MRYFLDTMVLRQATLNFFYSITKGSISVHRSNKGYSGSYSTPSFFNFIKDGLELKKRVFHLVKERTRIGLWEPLTCLYRRKFGSKCDMLFRKLACDHDDILEFGATEAGKDYDGDDATKKKLMEGCIKLPICLKDMLDNLEMHIQAIADIEVVGFILALSELTVLRHM